MTGIQVASSGVVRKGSCLSIPRYSRCMRYVLLLLLSALTAALVAATSHTAVRAPEVAVQAPPDAVVRGCRSRGEAGAPIRMRVTTSDVRIGPLVIVNVRNRTAVGPTDESEWPFAAKAPVLLPARSRVVLAIAPEAATRRGVSASRVGVGGALHRVLRAGTSLVIPGNHRADDLLSLRYRDPAAHGLHPDGALD